MRFGRFGRLGRGIRNGHRDGGRGCHFHAGWCHHHVKVHVEDISINAHTPGIELVTLQITMAVAGG